jgi:hypothetical protein
MFLLRMSIFPVPLLRHYVRVALHLDLHKEVVIRVHSTFISKFSIKMNKLKVTPNLIDSTKEMEKIPSGDKGVKSTEP